MRKAWEKLEWLFLLWAEEALKDSVWNGLVKAEKKNDSKNYLFTLFRVERLSMVDGFFLLEDKESAEWKPWGTKPYSVPSVRDQASLVHIVMRN